MAKPKVGDKIYVEGTIYLTHGADDFQGGLCTVRAVETHVSAGGEKKTRVEIDEDPGTLYTWDGYLETAQEEWKRQYGEQRAQLKPDLRPDFNDYDGGWEKD
jgi:hypothetical protein